MLEQSSVVLKFIAKLDTGFTNVQRETNTLQETCNNLLSEQQRLSTLSEGINDNLRIFNNLEEITRTLHTPGADLVTRPSFSKLLTQLDEGLVYVDEHKKFKDMERYSQRFRHCMTRALSLIQVYFQNTLKDLSNDIQQQSAKITNEGAHLVLLYSKFEAESSDLYRLTNEISKRSTDNQEYQGLLNDCTRVYFATRSRLLTARINKNLEESIKDPRDIVQFTRSLLGFYREMCSQEYNLFLKLFDIDNDNVANAFMEWLMDLCNSLYDTVRQRIIRENDIPLLCELASVLLSYKEEAEEAMIDDGDQRRLSISSMGTNTPWNQNMESNSQSYNGGQLNGEYNSHEQSSPPPINFFELFKPVLQDVQTRLLFKVQAYVEQEIVRHVPTDEDIHGLGGRKQKKNVTKGHSRASSLAQDADFDMNNIFGGWYPPMRKAISLLSQINQLVNSTTFDDLAHRVVHECLVSLQAAHALAVTRLGSRIEADLFLIKHLLILRNQILEFDIEYVPTDVHIDFSGISEVISLVRKEGVSLNRQRLLNLAKISVPKVVNNMFDAKEELYAQLRNSIHSFTEESVKLIVAPITRTTDSKDDDSMAETALADTRKMRENASVEIPKLRNLMLNNYIDDTRTVDILIDSIQDLVIQAYEKYHDEVVTKCKNQEQIDGLMEVEGLITWFSGIIADLHGNPTHYSVPTLDNEEGDVKENNRDTHKTDLESVLNS